MAAKPVEDRQGERGGLAGTGLGGREHVAAGEHERDRPGLDGGGLDVALLGDGLKQVGRQAERIEGHVAPESPHRVGRGWGVCDFVSRSPPSTPSKRRGASPDHGEHSR